jgi:FtsP/CotA-like multicopper oxidase with cupredoxin domain
MTPYDGNTAYLIEGCEWNTRYKYLCGNTTSSIPAYRRRWKDVYLINTYTVAVIRIRWASTGYDESKQRYPFFKVPEDQLIEFPGYVYHCHILPHEDNEMMRPIMMRPSEEYLQHFNKYKKKDSCSGRTWL